MRSTTYHTKQQEAIMRYLVSLNGSHCTAAQIIGYFDQAETPIGRTTVYRHLDQLTESGKIRRYTT
ncbi:MAG: transcriptional repressor, partial [Peptococcaceae bacterium]|nr:transcriptional repressor [Peptococcaceae bacterium]